MFSQINGFFVSVFMYKIIIQFHDLTAGREINRIRLLTLQYGKNKYIWVLVQSRVKKN